MKRKGYTTQFLGVMECHIAAACLSWEVALPEDRVVRVQKTVLLFPQHFGWQLRVCGTMLPSPL